MPAGHGAPQHADRAQVATGGHVAALRVVVANESNDRLRGAHCRPDRADRRCSERRRHGICSCPRVRARANSPPGAGRMKIAAAVTLLASALLTHPWAHADTGRDIYLVLHLGDRRLYVLQVGSADTKRLGSFPVAVGKKGYETPTGRFQVKE